MNAHTPILTPYGMPKGMDPQQWRQSVEKRLNDLLDRAMSLITALDLMEADCDLEDGADGEPWLGWGGKGLSTVTSSFQDGRGSPHDDRELDDADDEEGGDAEPSQDGEHIMWGDDLASQEVLVESGI